MYSFALSPTVLVVPSHLVLKLGQSCVIVVVVSSGLGGVGQWCCEEGNRV